MIGKWTSADDDNLDTWFDKWFGTVMVVAGAMALALWAVIIWAIILLVIQMTGR